MHAIKYVFATVILSVQCIFAMEESLAEQQSLNALLCTAAQMGNLDEVKQWVQAGADPVMQSREHGATPLMKAADAGHLPVVRYLVEQGAKINEMNITLGMTPFHRAIQMGHFSVVKYLADNRADLFLQNTNKRSPKKIAQIYAKYKIATLLKELSSELSYETITYSAQKNNYTHVAELLTKDRTCVNVQDETGCTALLWATKNDNYEMAKILLNYGADKNISNRNGVTPLDIALQAGYAQIVNLLSE
jgi:ankyrin repeat protein